MLRSGWAAASMVAALCWWSPLRTASACGTCDPAGGISLADDAAVRPANAGFVIRNVEDPSGWVEAWVDGVPAQVEPIDGVQVHAPYRGSLARIVPAPPVGAEVEILASQEEVCFGRSRPRPAEPETYVAGPPDESAPEELAGLQWDLHDVDYAATDSCQTSIDLVVHVRGTLVDEPEGQAMRLVDVEVARGSQTVASTIVGADAEVDGAILLEPPPPGDPPGDVCVRVTVADLAGHRSEPSPWICNPCHAVVSDAPTDVWPEEPAWTDADLVDDGHCAEQAPPAPDPSDSGTTGPDDGDGGAADVDETGAADPTATTSGLDVDTETGSPLDAELASRGCGCQAGPRSGPPGLAMLVLVLASRRRRAP